MNRYRVWMHTSPSPGSTFYRGYVDVVAEDSDQAQQRAKDAAYRGALHRGLVVDRVELLK